MPQRRPFRLIAAFLVMLTVAALGILSAASLGTRAAAAPVTTALDASADSYVYTGGADTNSGGATTLKASQTSYHVLLRFQLNLPAGSRVTDVELRLYSQSQLIANLVVHASSDTWNEYSVTAATQPAWQSAELARSGLLQKNQYATATLPTNSVPSSGAVSFGVNTTTGVTASLASRETSTRPQLVVAYEPAAAPAATATPVPVGASVSPLVENASFSGSGDIADDAAIWADKANPGNSVVIADNKATTGGGIGVFDMNGALLQFSGDGAMGNVDLRDGFPLSGGSVVLVGANNRTTNAMELWALSTSSRRLSPVAARSIATFAPNYGFCMYHSKASGKFYAFVTPNGAGSIQQFELGDNGAGMVDAMLVRTLPVSSITESCVADDELGHLYVGQEDVALWKYGAEPSAGSSRVSVDTAGAGRLVADIEGMSIAYAASGSGYLIVSSQGDSTIAVYDRAADNAFIKKITVVAHGVIDRATGTDGLDVTTMSVGPGFEQGMLVVHDQSNADGATSNLKYVPMSSVMRALQS